MKYTVEMDETRKSQAIERGIIAAVVRAVDSSVLFELKSLIPHPELFSMEGGLWKQLIEASLDTWPPSVTIPDNWVPSDNPVVDAERLREVSKRRQFARLQDKLASLMSSDNATTADMLKVLETATAETRRIDREFRRNDQTQPGQMLSVREAMTKLYTDLVERWKDIEERGRDAVQIGVPTGIARLDHILGGLQVGVHCVAAEPGKGKTSLVLQIAANAASIGVPTLFVSFEEGVDRLAWKLVCSRARMEAKQFYDGYQDPSALIGPKLDEVCAGLQPLRFVTGGPTLTVSQLRGLAEQLMASSSGTRCLVIVDYLQQWARMRRGSGSDFRLEVSQLSTDLRGLAQDLASPVLMISSQNREGQGTASMRSLKESGDLEYGADSLWFLVEDKEGEAEMRSPCDRAVKIDVQKNRFGDHGFAPLTFKANIGTFEERGQSAVQIRGNMAWTGGRR